MSEEINQSEINENLFDDFTPVTYEEWVVAAEKALKGAPFDSKMMTKTYEEITLKPIYRQEELGEGAFADSMPGSAPFVRSSKVDGYIKKPWLIAQECDQAKAEDVNVILKIELERGLQAIYLKLDTASFLGQDPDTAKTEDIFNKGVSLSSLKDLEKVFFDIDIKALPLRIHCGASSIPMLSLFYAFNEKQKKDSKKLTGCIAADPIGVLAKSGTLNDDLTSLYDQMASSIKWASEHAPEMRTVLVDVSCYHDAGANAIQELAFAIATAVEYAKQMAQRGIEFAVFAKHMQFAFSVGANMFMELAKIRALRLLWSQVCNAYDCLGEECAANIHVRTSFFTKTIYDPYVNLLRTTTESFAAAVGGVDSMHVGPLDEIIRRGDLFSRRISRNTQIMLQRECNLLQPIDPAGGSWYIETITEELAKRAWELFTKVENDGGIVSALEKELPQKEAEKTYASRVASISKRKNVIVGTNSYANLGEKLLEEEKLPSAKELDERKQEVATYKKAQDANKCKESLKALKDVKEKSSQEILATAIKAVLAGATLGEVTSTLQNKAIGQLKIRPLTLHRNAEVFENLRQTTEKYVAKTGNNVRIFSANMGPIPQHKGRADFSRGFFEVGAFEVIGNDGFQTVEEVAEAAVKAKPDVVVICSTDKTYPELVPPLAKMLKEKINGVKIFLAGQAPADMREIYIEAGVDDFVFKGADCYKILSDLQARKGMTA